MNLTNNTNGCPLMVEPKLEIGDTSNNETHDKIPTETTNAQMIPTTDNKGCPLMVEPKVRRSESQATSDIHDITILIDTNITPRNTHEQLNPTTDNKGCPNGLNPTSDNRVMSNNDTHNRAICRTR